MSRTPPSNENYQESKKRRESTGDEINTMKETFEEILKGIREEMKKIGRETKETNEEIMEIKELLERDREERRAMREEICFLRDRVAKLEANFERRENLERKNNIIAKGIEEDEEEDQIKTRSIIEKLFKEKLKIEPVGIDRVMRLGRERGKYPRPILIKMNELNKKISVMKERPKLKGTRIFLEDDYSDTIRNKRKRLLEMAKETNVPRNEIKLRGDKIWIRKKLYELGMEEGEEILSEIELKNEAKKNLPARGQC